MMTMMRLYTKVLLSAIAIIAVVNGFYLTPFHHNRNAFYSKRYPFIHDPIRENVPSITSTSLNMKNQQYNQIIQSNCYIQQELLFEHQPRPRLRLCRSYDRSCYDSIRNNRRRNRLFMITMKNQEQEIETITATTSNQTTTFNDTTTTTTTKVTTRTTNIDNITFCTPPIPVYIEDTDAYGVMYNGNYIRAYDRSFHYYSNKNTIGDSWIMVHIQELKFKIPPKLGDCFCITGIMSSTIDNDSNNSDHKKEIQRWDMSMHSVDGSIVYSTAAGVQVIHASDTVLSTTVLTQQRNHVPTALISSQDNNAHTTNLVDTFVTYHDEYDIIRTKFQQKSLSYYYLPLHTCLKYMERSRSNFIGGPIRLQQLQAQDNVLYVVTSLKDSSSLVPYCESVGTTNEDNDLTSDTTMNSSHPLSLIPCSNVHVKTSFVVRKKGMVIDCYHTIVINHTASPCQIIVARGHLTLIALDAITRRPTNKIPLWLQQKIMK